MAGVTFLVVAGLFALLGAGWVSIAIGAAVAAIWVGAAWFNGPSLVLDLCDVDPADPQVDARLFNVTGGLCAAMGLSMPDLYVVEDAALNALAVGRDSRSASLVVTRGLLEGTTLVEFEAIVALQLFRIKTLAILPDTFAVPTIGAPAVIAEALDRWDFLHRLFLMPFPLVQRLMARVHPPQEELEADVAAMEFTRYPPGLAAGLSKMEGKTALGVIAPVTAHLWVAPPVSPSLDQASTSRQLHAPLKNRIAVLSEL